jgi:hypothetical protein
MTNRASLPPKNFREAMELVNNSLNKGVELDIFELLENDRYYYSKRFNDYFTNQMETKFIGMEFFKFENMVNIVLRYLTPTQLHSTSSSQIHGVVKMVQTLNTLVQERAVKEGYL